MKNILVIGVLSIAAFLLVSCNQNTRINGAESKPSKALFLVWNTDNQGDLWRKFEKEVFPTIKERYTADKIKYAFPFSHNPLSHPDKEGQWTNSVLIGLDAASYEVTGNKILDIIQKSRLKEALVAADILNLQKGLDMFYSIENGIKEEAQLEQIVEYVFSDPEAQEKYYGEQYIFSGPAMQELHAANSAGRFIGYEVDTRLYGADFPAWDLIHVVGFTKEQSERATPIFMQVWDTHAERAFGKGMTFLKKKSEWDKIRLNIKSDATQEMNITLPLISRD